MSHLAKPILQVGKLSPGPALPPAPLAACWSWASPQPRLASRPWERRLRRHMEEALRELRVWGSGAGSGSSSGSGSDSGSAVGPMGNGLLFLSAGQGASEHREGEGVTCEPGPAFRGSPGTGSGVPGTGGAPGSAGLKTEAVRRGSQPLTQQVLSHDKSLGPLTPRSPHLTPRPAGVTWKIPGQGRSVGGTLLPSLHLSSHPPPQAPVVGPQGEGQWPPGGGARKGCAGGPEQVPKVWPPLDARSPRAEVCVGSSGTAWGSQAAQGPTGSRVGLRASEPTRQGELAVCSQSRSVNSVHMGSFICATLPGVQSTATVETLTCG